MTSIKTFIIPVFALLCLHPVVDPALALLAGVLCALLFSNPHAAITEKLPKTLLMWCVIGLGGGMNLQIVLQAGASGFAYTAISIAATLALGLGLARVLKLEKQCAILITAGTAICGGSAIAAIAPAIGARASAVAVSLAVVFILNALALLIFPAIGHALELTQAQFGLWSALAIHDTSSVVGAGMKYGEEALQIGTSVKLARALWIVPLVFAVQAFYKPSKQEGAQENAKPKYPWFILGFLALAALVTFLPLFQPAGEWIAFVAKRGLVLTLFLIGVNINAEVMKTVGIKPFILGAVLWALVSSLSLLAIVWQVIL